MQVCVYAIVKGSVCRVRVVYLRSNLRGIRCQILSYFEYKKGIIIASFVNANQFILAYI